MNISTWIAVALSGGCLVACLPEAGEEAQVDEAALGAAPAGGATLGLDPTLASNLSVTATVTARHDRRFLWNMTLTAPAPISLPVGASRFVSFPLDIVNTGVLDTGPVSGTIAVQNTGATKTALYAVTAQVGEFAATVSCPVAFPTTLAPSGTLTCTYAVTVPGAVNRRLFAVAYGADLAYTRAAVTFTGLPVQDYDRVVEATAPGVGHVYTADASFEPTVHTSFTRQVGPYPTCGTFSFLANAYLRALNGAGSLRSGLLAIDRAASLAVNVACPLR